MRTSDARQRSRYAELARVAAEIATDVGDAIVVEDIGIVTRKPGRANFATTADHAAENAIITALRRLDPAVPVLAEESATKAARAAERLWVVDPIDGTLNFSRSIPFYCVVIGYVEDGQVRAGAVHAPRLRETFVATQGGGATLNGAPIKVGGVRRVADAFAVTSLGYRAASRSSSRFVALNAACARLRVIGSAALEVCYVAMGRLDLFVHEFLSPWDIAAPQLIAREAGAVVVSLKTGGDATWDEPQVIIGNPALVKDTLASVPLVRAKKAGPRR